jgi:S-adenosylmethionine:tRNA ribosyltransferase-isomerase
MVVSSDAGTLEDARFAELERLLEPGDLLVVNDAAAMPASVGLSCAGQRAEARLLRGDDPCVFEAVLLGAGDFSLRTEERGEPPRLEAGASVVLDGGIEAVVEEVDERSRRLVRLRLPAAPAAAWERLYAAGRAIQYAYTQRPLALWDVQTCYASRPWASEMPSAGWPLSFATLSRVRARGAEVSRVTHGAGLSSTGEPALDARLPLPERFAVDETCVAAVATARRRGGRVIAVGTSVVRALEAAALPTGALEPAQGTTALLVGASTSLAVADAVLTGMHEVGTSHFALLEAFADRALLERATLRGAELGYLLHEHGDSMLVLGPRRAPAAKVA